MKRLLAMGLSLGLLGMLPQVGTHAEDGVQLCFAQTGATLSTDESATGEVTLSLPIFLTQSQALAALQGTIFVAAPLRVESFTFAPDVTAHAEEAAFVPELQRVLWMTADGVAQQPSAEALLFATLTVSVPIGTSAGSYAVSMQECYAFGAQAAAVPIAVTATTVTVWQSAVTTTTPPPLVLPEHCGDVNMDGTPDADDATLCLRYYLAKLTGDAAGATAIIPMESARLAADVNQSGSIDPDDAVLILRFYVENLLKPIPWEQLLKR